MACIFLRPNFAGVLKGPARDARGGLFGDDLDALHHARHDLVLDARVQSLGIFADDDEIDARIAGGDAGKIADGAEVAEQFELPAQLHVDAAESAADGRGHRPFQRHPGALDGLDQLLGNVLVIFGKGVGPGCKALPLKLPRRWLPEHGLPRQYTSGPIPSPGINVTLCAIRPRLNSYQRFWNYSLAVRCLLRSAAASAALASRTSLERRRSCSSDMNSCTSLKSR